MRFVSQPLPRMLAALMAVLLAAAGLPAAAQGESMHRAGNSVVTFGDTWMLEPDYSTSENVFLSHGSLRATAFVYTETREIATSSVDAALDGFAGVFLGAVDPGSSRVVAGGTLADATGWRLYAATIAGIPAATAITANVSAEPGVAILSLVMAPAGSIDLAVEDVAADIRIDGQPAPLAALDPAQLVAALEGAANPASTLPTQAAGPVTTVAPTAIPSVATATSAPVVVDGVDYRALDAPAGCDRIGWAIIDPTQLPTSEPELDARAACAGGVSYVATCGTVPGERADTRYITCEVTALVTDGPQTFGFDMFELFDADGDAEYVDLGMSFGKDDLFPGGEVQEGATVSGTASFAIDATATDPLLLEIRPPSLAGGVEPAVIVIEGPLQERAAFD